MRRMGLEVSWRIKEGGRSNFRFDEPENRV